MSFLCGNCHQGNVLSNNIALIWFQNLANDPQGHLKVIQKQGEYTKVLYMSSSFLLLGIESRYFSQAEKERTASKAEQIHKMTTTIMQ